MENAGAISEGIGQYGNNVALVTPIEQMLGEPVEPPSSAPRLGTYVDEQTVYAFGHELDGAGRRALLLQDAYVYYVVNNPDPTVAPSYKPALPGHTVGIVSSDTPNAVIGQVRSRPPSVPVGVTVHDLDAGTSLALNTLVADETDVGLPLGTSLLDTIAPLDVAQAATQIYNGESGRMCLRIYSGRAARRSDSAIGTSASARPAIRPPCRQSWPAPPRPTSRPRSASWSRSTSPRYTSSA
jgi:hypothetical protein